MYKIKLIGSVNSQSSFTDNLEKSLRKCKCNDHKSNLEFMTAKDGLLTFKCVDFNKTYEKTFDEDLSKRCKNPYQFCQGNINKFCIMVAERCTWMAGKDSMKHHYLQRRDPKAT